MEFTVRKLIPFFALPALCAALSCSSDPTTQASSGLGDLAISVTGVGGLVPPSISVSGPGESLYVITASATLTGLAPGTYWIHPAAVQEADGVYNADAVVIAFVVSGKTARATVAYRLASGSIALALSGLPGAVPPRIDLSALISGTVVTLTSGADTARYLTPGTYVLTPAIVADTSARPSIVTYVALPETVAVAISPAPTTARISYGARTGSLSVTIDPTGLPTGLAPSVQVVGQFGNRDSSSVSTVYPAIPLGTYSISATPVRGPDWPYSAEVASGQATLGVGSFAGAVSVGNYFASGGLVVTVRCSVPGIGLPCTGTPIYVTGPNYRRTITRSGRTSLSSLHPGTYTIVAANYRGMSPTPLTQEIVVSASFTSSLASIVYK